ncbi:hypothetical protein F2P56_031700 [Juglans regia]|uniref:Uncharacterized protein LOC118344532 n=2 Tax=Juglans regia TaxID=51240 RepID=A0A6P9E053_JUGRE|nr:uncharacterized protein LOC118344532 [Juglans regia]XP_035541380.1 uncharacterized protein LOC118344532 [Juglans regia]XP_035541381.1 uncharacterized protein LOC118344532 [Juglans regia]KAF5446037.1 hypothetical protein F2P56_031700 [Juglans regia]
MSPASKSKSKSKNKPSAGSVKEQQKTSSKPSGSNDNGGGSPASIYNSVSGTFHALETSSIASSPPFHDSGHFLNMDDTDEHSSSPHGTVSKYDSVSNNGSCSGESEDPKEKIAHFTPKQEAIPGSDIDRREKIRLKNERKHQRQREKRAQELHDRCSGYLMSRKLEELSQKLVRMGFPSERAIFALMLNEGKVEESVAYLLDGNEEEAQQKHITNLGSGANLKIDISEDLAWISVLEERYKCSKQEVERTVVTCEGDLEKAEDTLRAQKQEQSATPLKAEEIAETKNLIRPKEVPAASVTIQQRRNERDFNYPKETAAVATFPEPGNRNLQVLKSNQLKTLAEERWAATGSGPSASLNLVPPTQLAPPAGKVEVRVGVVGNEGRILQQGLGGLRGSVVVMQRPQSTNAKQDPVSSVSAFPSAVQWYGSSVPAVESIRSNGKVIQNQSRGSLGWENQSSEHFHHQAPYKDFPFSLGPVDPTSAGLGGSWRTSGASSPMVPSDPRGSRSTMGGSSHSLTFPSSLGLFSGHGSAGTFGLSSPMDWNTGGLMPELDYTNIDWTLNYPLPSKSNGLLLGLSSLLRNSSGMRLGSANGKFRSGLQDGGVATEAPSSAGSRDWTTPFAGKDIFSVPRQFVTFPSP